MPAVVGLSHIVCYDSVLQIIARAARAEIQVQSSRKNALVVDKEKEREKERERKDAETRMRTAKKKVCASYFCVMSILAHTCWCYSCAHFCGVVAHVVVQVAVPRQLSAESLGDDDEVVLLPAVRRLALLCQRHHRARACVQPAPTPSGRKDRVSGRKKAEC
jgi:hypothetical protein